MDRDACRTTVMKSLSSLDIASRMRSDTSTQRYQMLRQKGKSEKSYVVTYSIPNGTSNMHLARPVGELLYLDTMFFTKKKRLR